MKLGGIYISIRAKTDKFKRDLAKAKTMTEKASVHMRRAIRRINFAKVGIAAAAFTTGLVLMTKKVVSLGREFESTMKTVQAWSGATGKDLKDLTDIARKMGATTEHTATEAAGALKFLAAAGFSAKKSIAALPGTLDLATAGQVDLASATDITTDVLTAFGLEVDELTRINDAFITASSSSNTNVMMLGQSFKMVAPTANLFGLSIEETAGFLGTLANSMVKSEMAGSGLNMVLLRSAKAAKMLGLAAGTPLITILRKMKEEQWDAGKIAVAFGARQVKTAAILMKQIPFYEKLTKKIRENKREMGLFESQVDIVGITNTVRRELQKQKSSLGIILDKDIDKIDFDDICKYYNSPEDNLVKKIIDGDIIKMLAIGIASLIAVIDTEVIIVNGRIIELENNFIDKFRNAIYDITPFKPRIVISDLKKDASILGEIKFGLNYMDDLLYSRFFSLS